MVNDEFFKILYHQSL